MTILKNGLRKNFIQNILLLAFWIILTRTSLRSLLLGTVCRNNNFEAIILQLGVIVIYKSPLRTTIEGYFTKITILP